MEYHVLIAWRRTTAINSYNMADVFLVYARRRPCVGDSIPSKAAEGRISTLTLTYAL
jgi:hypothetical protein